MIVGLVGCAAAKLKRPAPAAQLYTSPLFRKCSEYARRNSDVWFILSAKHGLVAPEEVLEPYDTKLGTSSGPPIWDWAERVVAQLDAQIGDEPDVELLVLAGEQYRTILRRTDYLHRVPMLGLGIGEQLAWLTRELA